MPLDHACPPQRALNTSTSPIVSFNVTESCDADTRDSPAASFSWYATRSELRSMYTSRVRVVARTDAATGRPTEKAATGALMPVSSTFAVSRCPPAPGVAPTKKPNERCCVSDDTRVSLS